MAYQQELPWQGAVAARARPARSGSEDNSANQTEPGNPSATKRSGPSGAEWRIDEPTRRAGRRGLAQARATLARVQAASHEGTAA